LKLALKLSRSDKEPMRWLKRARRPEHPFARGPAEQAHATHSICLGAIADQSFFATHEFGIGLRS
jgi:hypothetical protein